MRIHLTSVFVDDQDEALAFYTEILGFEKKTEIPMGEARWLTVVSPGDPDGTELVLEPSRPPGRATVQGSARGRRHPVHVVRGRRRPREFERLQGLGVRFVQEPVEMGPVTTAVFDDTCGNLLQIAARK